MEEIDIYIKTLIQSFTELGLQHNKTEGKVVFFTAPKGKKIESDLGERKIHIFDKNYIHLRSVDDLDEETLKFMLD